MARIRGVFFDWVGTVARPEPDRHMGIYLAAKKLGYELPIEKLSRSVYKAENEVMDGMPGAWREAKGEAPFLKWWDIVLADTGIELPKEIKLEITKIIASSVRNLRWVLYEDVTSVLESLKNMGYRLGVISNLYAGRGLLDSLLDLAVTAEDVGAKKPNPLIFSAALKQAKVKAEDSIYVGDQYEIDIVGARNAGIRPILIDRYNVVLPNETDCPVIRSFEEILDYI
jgi:putative hydrolase of the HAD superfamily